MKIYKMTEPPKDQQKLGQIVAEATRNQQFEITTDGDTTTYKGNNITIKAEDTDGDGAPNNVTIYNFNDRDNNIEITKYFAKFKGSDTPESYLKQTGSGHRKTLNGRTFIGVNTTSFTSKTKYAE